MTKYLIAVLVFLIPTVTAALAAIRCLPDFPARRPDWLNIYISMTHIWVGGMLLWPLVFWLLKFLIQLDLNENHWDLRFGKGLAPDESAVRLPDAGYVPPDLWKAKKMENQTAAAGAATAEAIVYGWLSSFNRLAHVSFWPALFASIVIELVLFLVQVDPLWKP